MQTFKNKNFVKRDYECTNVVACVAESAPNENYIDAPEFDISDLTHIYSQNGVKYYGFL